VHFDELASGGYGLLEAPVWDGAGGVYFSDVLQGGVRRWSAGGMEEVLPKRRGIGGMCLHADGGLVVSGRDVIHVLGEAQRTLLGDLEGVTGFNDLGTDGEGRVYVGALRFKPFAGESPTPGQVWRIRYPWMWLSATQNRLFPPDHLSPPHSTHFRWKTKID